MITQHSTVRIIIIGNIIVITNQILTEKGQHVMLLFLTKHLLSDWITSNK